jgi:hypothetical protein
MSDNNSQFTISSPSEVSLPGGELSSGKNGSKRFEYETVIDRICKLGWNNLTADNLVNVAWAYYYFSVQFRENLEIACNLYPHDVKLQHLKLEECDTDNLSPWPGVVGEGERINHDEFVSRLLTLWPIGIERRKRLEEVGSRYLTRVRWLDATVRASSIASYEDGGLTRVFRAILECRHWDNPLLRAFEHFLTEHIRFDEQGHAALCRHLRLDDRILPLWIAFKFILVESVPRLNIKRGQL